MIPRSTDLLGSSSLGHLSRLSSQNAGSITAYVVSLRSPKLSGDQNNDQIFAFSSLFFSENVLKSHGTTMELRYSKDMIFVPRPEELKGRAEPCSPCLSQHSEECSLAYMYLGRQLRSLTIFLATQSW